MIKSLKSTKKTGHFKNNHPLENSNESNIADCSADGNTSYSSIFSLSDQQKIAMFHNFPKTKFISSFAKNC